MATLKPDIDFIWSESSAAADKVKPADTKIQSGWAANEIPPYTAFNWWQNRADTAVKHLHENGVSDWSVDTSYTLGAWAKGSNDKLYRSKLDGNVGVDPVTDLANSNWELIYWLPVLSDPAADRNRSVRVNAAGDDYTLVPAPTEILKNKLINGDMSIWQRGVTFTIVGAAYTSDRWLMAGGCDGIIYVNRQPVSSNDANEIYNVLGFAPQYYKEIDIQKMDASITMRQYIERAFLFSSSDWTFSLVICSDTGGEFELQSKITLDNGEHNFVRSQTFTTGAIFERFSWTFSVPDVFSMGATTPQLGEIEVKVIYKNPGKYKVTALQLEEGTEETSYDYRPQALEILFAQRYFETGVSGVTGYWQADQHTEAANTFRVSKRIVPTLYWLEITAANMKTTDLLDSGNNVIYTFNSWHVNAVFDSSVFQGYTKDNTIGDGHWLGIWYANSEVNMSSFAKFEISEVTSFIPHGLYMVKDLNNQIYWVPNNASNPDLVTIQDWEAEAGNTVIVGNYASI